jgi:predicted ATPase
MYVRSLELSNFRCFDHARIELPVPCPKVVGSNITLVLGNNGVGKSSLLRALALTTLSGIIDQSGFVPRYLVRWSGKADREASLVATVELEPQDAAMDSERTTEQVGVRIVRRRDTERIKSAPERRAFWDGLFEEDSPSFLVLGYGVTRREDASGVFDPQSQLKLRSARYQRIAGLFEDQVALVPLRAWLPRLPGPRRDEVVTLLNALLPESVRLHHRGELNVHGDLLWLQEPATITPQSALSDGYRGFISLISDLLYQLQRVAPTTTPLTELSGLVLIDEIDLHLHPSWQRVVAPTFARVLPRLQFVMTTHSPIVAGTLRPENILLLEFAETKDESGLPVVAKRLKESIHGLNADQILVSSYFGLDTTRAQEAIDGQNDLARQAAAGDKNAAVEFIRRLAAGDRGGIKP